MYRWAEEALYRWLAVVSQENSKNANEMRSDASGCRQIVAKSEEQSSSQSQTIEDPHFGHRKLSTSIRLLPALSTTEYNSDFSSGDNAIPHQKGFPTLTILDRLPVAYSKKSRDV